jgi:hypothetical protein
MTLCYDNLSAADPALFARQLMHHAYLELERYDNIDDPCFYHYDDVDPVQILQKSFEASLVDAEKEVRKKKMVQGRGDTHIEPLVCLLLLFSNL